MVSELGLNKDNTDNLLSDVVKYLDGALKGSFFSGGKKVRLEKIDQAKIRKGLEEILNSFASRYAKGRTSLLERQRDSFMSDVKLRIEERSDISEDAKRYVLYIPAPEISKKVKSIDLKTIISDNTEEHRPLKIFKAREYLDKEGAIEDIKTDVLGVITNQRDEYADDYRKSLASIIEGISGEFTTRLGQYSLLMKALIENREAMVELGRKVDDAARDLLGCQNQLNATIWKEISHA